MSSRPPPNPFGFGAQPLSGVPSNYAEYPGQDWQDIHVIPAKNMPTSKPTVTIKKPDEPKKGGKRSKRKRSKRKRSKRRL